MIWRLIGQLCALIVLSAGMLWAIAPVLYAIYVTWKHRKESAPKAHYGNFDSMED